MQKAVKRETPSLVTNLSDEILIPGNDTDDGPANRNLAQLRDKITSSRLENLMARQLENDLSINRIEVVETEESENTRPGRAQAENNSTDHEKLLVVCSELVEKISVSTQILAELGTNSEALVSFLNARNNRSDSLKDAHSRILDLETIVEQQHQKLLEFQKLAKAQRKRIDVLEIAGTVKNADLLSGDLGFLKEALEDKQNEIDKCHARIEETDSQLKTVSERNGELEERFEQSSDLLRQANKVLRQKINALAAQTAAREKSEAQRRDSLEKFASLQEEYDQLNRRILDQQSRHHAKVEKLEDQVHILRHQIKSMQLAG